MRSIPIRAATLSAFLVDTPFVTISDTAAITALHPRVANEQVLREEAAAPELGYAQADDADAGDEVAFAVAVPLVALAASVLGLRVHDLIDGRLGHDADKLPDVDHPVIESGYVVACRRPLL